MIHHLPDAATHQIVIAIDFLPVCFRIPGADSHSMCIFTEKIRSVIQAFLLPAVLANHVHLRHGRIHFTADIIRLSPAVDSAFIVHRQWRTCLQIVIHGIRVAVSAGLVAQRPQDNCCVAMQFIPLIQVLNPVKITRTPFRIMADRVISRRKLMGKSSMCFQIVFIYDINTKFVCQLQQKRIGRIV